MTERVLTGGLEQARGVIGREPTGDDRVRFVFDGVRERSVHMVGVTTPLRVTWLADGTVTQRETLRPWVGHGRAPADEILEEAAATEATA